MERRIQLTKAWDRRDKDPAKDYGVHGVEVVFTVIGELGAVQWRLMTPWVLPKTQKWWDEINNTTGYTMMPCPAPLIWHERVADGHGQKCDVLGYCRCEQAGSFMSAHDIYVTLTEKGDDGVWAILEAAYERQAKTCLH